MSQETHIRNKSNMSVLNCSLTQLLSMAKYAYVPCFMTEMLVYSFPKQNNSYKHTNTVNKHITIVFAQKSIYNSLQVVKFMQTTTKRRLS